MPDSSNIKKSMKLAQANEHYIDSKLKDLQKKIAAEQERMLNHIYANYVTKLTVDAKGKLLNNAKNIKLINELDAVIDSWNVQFQKNVIAPLAKDLIKLSTYNRPYFLSLGYKEGVVENIFDKMDLINKAIGINANGTLIKDSYLYNLAQNNQLRTELKDYVIKNVLGKTKLKDFTKGFKDLVVGNKRVDGRLENYYKQFVYDTVNRVDSAQKLYVADELELEYFIYQGQLMKTSRPFCINRAGKVWSREDVAKWEAGDLTDAEMKGLTKPMNFYINRGGYNCQHSIRWISKEYARKLGYPVKDKK